MLVGRQPDGSLQGVFRNPERNWTGGAPSFRLSRERDSISFADPVTGEERFAQPYDSAQRRITIDFAQPVVLTPRTRDQAVGFFPRLTVASSYVYRVPDSRPDGWRTGRAAAVGLDEARLAELIQRIPATDPAAAGIPLIHSVLVARRNRLVLEEYFSGYSAERPHDLRSASKTFTSVMAAPPCSPALP